MSNQERPHAVNILVPGESYTYSFQDDLGFPLIAPWGIAVPDLTINCVKRNPNGKALEWHYTETFIDFIFESCSKGVSNKRFDNYIWEITGHPCYSLTIVQNPSRRERYELLTKTRLQLHKDAVLNLQDLDTVPQYFRKEDIDLAKEYTKARLGVLGKLDPDFKNDLEINHKFAQINIAPKHKKE